MLVELQSFSGYIQCNKEVVRIIIRKILILCDMEIVVILYGMKIENVLIDHPLCLILVNLILLIILH